MSQSRIVVVTGGSGLIGKAIIADLKSNGFKPLNMDISFSEELPTNIPCDITDAKSIDKAIATTIEHYGEIHGLVNNAYPRTKDWGKVPFEETPLESWRQNVDWQLNSCVYLMQKVLKQMRKQQYGSIVNIASIYGVVGNDFRLYEGTPGIPPAAYPAIKGGLINLTRYLASLYGKDSIRVNCVSPGGIFDHQAASFVNAYESHVPLKRMGTPQDIAPSVRFLLSDDAKYITGHNLVVDGGWTAI